MERISKISSEIAQLQEEKNEALKMKLRGEVDLQTHADGCTTMDRPRLRRG